MSEFKVASGLGKSRVLRKKIKNLREIFGSFADNCYFCNQIEEMGRFMSKLLSDKIEYLILLVAEFASRTKISEAQSYLDHTVPYFYNIVETDSDGSNANRLAIGNFNITPGPNNAQAGGE